ncbi:MAG: 3-phosphoshikimate 1-carboxyvinyltransferase [Propionibacteriaceae bacterium]
MCSMHLITPSRIAGQLSVPASKSVAQRALLLAACADGTTTLRRLTPSADVLACANITRALGARVTCNDDVWTVIPQAQQRSEQVSCGESATALRLGAAIAALDDRPLTFHPAGTLATRPQLALQESLAAAGASVSYRDMSLIVQGPLHAGDMTIAADSSSQPLSGLILALPQLSESSTIVATDLASTPYIDLTISVASCFGMNLKRCGSQIMLSGGQQPYGVDLAVEADWSGAAFALVAGALAGDICLTGLDLESAQGDRAIVAVLAQVGAAIEYDATSIRVSSAASLAPFSYDATDTPDLFPPLVALATGCEGTSRITGVHRLRHKESDRAQALVTEFSSLGIQLGIDGDDMVISGAKPIGATVDSHNDHRIAMALAVAALRADGPIYLTGAEAVAKSWPTFFADLEELKA